METIAGIAAYIGFCLGVLKLFSMADSAASPEGKARARALLDFGWKDTVTRWPSVFVEMFDSIFGKRHFTWRCFWRSCVASLVAVVICTLVFWWLNPDHMIGAVGSSLLQYVLATLCLVALLNLIPDYVSLMETRLILLFLDTEDAKWTVICAALVIDLYATFSILAMGLFGLVFLWTGLSGVAQDGQMWGLIEEVSYIAKLLALQPWLDSEGNSLGTSLGVYLYSTFFTSIWLWLYALATFAGKLLLPVLNRIEGFKKLVDLDNKPFLALGWLSVMIVTVLFALGAVIKACV